MSASAPALVFDWTTPRRRGNVLIFFLGASLLLHGLCFYLFQVVYPPAITMLPPPARVSVITPENAEAQALVRWTEAEDPALATTPQRPPDRSGVSLPEIEHVPSYATHNPHLKTLPAPTPDTRIPSAASEAVVPRTPFRPLPPLATQKTAIIFEDGSENLGRLLTPDFKFQRTRPDAPANARFRVAIDEWGAIRFAFLAESSSDPALDEQAHRFLQLCRFQPAAAKSTSPQDALTWTSATIFWGSDLLAPGKPVPTP